MFTGSKNGQVNCKPVASNSSYYRNYCHRSSDFSLLTLKKSVQKYYLPTRGRQMITKAPFASSARYRSQQNPRSQNQTCQKCTNDSCTFLLFSTVIFNLKTVVKCTAGRELIYRVRTKLGMLRPKSTSSFYLHRYIFLYS